VNAGRVRRGRGTPFVLAAVLLLAGLPPLPAGAETPPRPFTVDYELRHNSLLIARMQRTLRAGENGTYVYEARSTAAGFLSAVLRDRVVETSVWRLDGGRPQPLQYEYHHTGGKEERHVELDFDWQGKVVVNIINEQPWSMKIPAGTQDKLLYQYTMMRDLQQAAETLEYEVADGGELKTYRFEVLGRETIRTALGRMETVKLRRASGKRRTVIWAAPQHGYMPVRVEQHRDRKVLTLTVSAIRIDE
jgi:hypothetical protein